MWRSSRVSVKQNLSSALRQNSHPLGLLRPLSEASTVSAAKSFSREDNVYHHHDKSRKILDASFERLPFHGLGKELSANWGKSLGYQLISRGYLTESKRDEYKFASSKGEVLNKMFGDEEQRIASGEVGQLNGLAPLEYEGLSEAQLYKKRLEKRMKIAMPVGIAPFALCNIDGGSNQMNALSVFDMSLQSSALLPLTLALFWHTNEGIKEILADYVHQETTRAWVSILFRLFILIVIKDLFFLL